MSVALALALAASIDGAAALHHASALAALGPHPWGSARNQAAAQYVASQLRAAGLTQVELSDFERHGIRGSNVIATLRGPSDEIVVACAHHDTAPEAPGAYDDGGGVGILIEVARVLAQDPLRHRTFVFASFDGEEAWATGRGLTAGSRAWLERLGPGGRRIVAAVAIEMSGYRKGTPLLHPIAYEDPRRSGGEVVAPGWLVRAALAGSKDAGAPLGVGDPWLSWLYQPTVRAFRVRLYGDDLSFLQAGHPAVMVSDSSFSAFYPDYHEAGDTADKLDAAALERMGGGVLGALRALDRVPRGSDDDPRWFAALGRVFGASVLIAVGVLSILPGLRAGISTGGPGFAARMLQAGLFALLLWRHTVPVLWVFLLPNLLPPLRRARWVLVLSLAPAASLVAFGVAAWWRGVIGGVWLAPWELAIALGALVLAFLRPPARRSSRRKRAR
jgi:Peptidase family M28